MPVGMGSGRQGRDGGATGAASASGSGSSWGRPPGSASSFGPTSRVGLVFGPTSRVGLVFGPTSRVGLVFGPTSRVGLGLEHVGEHGGGGDAVGGGVVDLGHEAEVAVLDALDHPQLPERVAPVQLAAGDVGDELAELARPPGRGDLGPVEVVGQVEIGILDPQGMV